MSLAKKLNAVANDNDRIIKSTIATLTTRLEKKADVGGQHLEYVFATGTNSEIRQAVRTWLTDQEFTVTLDREGDLTITWSIPPYQTLHHRVVDAIMKASKAGNTHVSVNLNMSPEEEVRDATATLTAEGYIVSVDSVYREISVSWN